MAFAAGMLLLNMVSVIDVTGMPSLPTASIAAFGAGWRSTHGHPWLYRPPLAATRWAFLLSATDWLLVLVAWYSGQDQPVMLPGMACGGAGAAVAWRITAGWSAWCGPGVGGATLLDMVVVIAATLLVQHTAGTGRSGVCFAFAVLLNLSLLDALIMHIR